MNYLTIPSFKSMSAQEVFDMSAGHLLKQGKQCQDDTETCLYRGENGMACAAGVFLTDEGAKAADNPKEMLGHSCPTAGWEHLVFLEAVPCKHVELIRALQGIHDYILPSGWKTRLSELADRENLSDAVCHEPV
jgi:hypothetical protein